MDLQIVSQIAGALRHSSRGVPALSPQAWRPSRIHLETGDWRLETGDWRLETGDWRLETGDWRLETGDCEVSSPGGAQSWTGDWGPCYSVLIDPSEPGQLTPTTASGNRCNEPDTAWIHIPNGFTSWYRCHHGLFEHVQKHGGCPLCEDSYPTQGVCGEP